MDSKIAPGKKGRQYIYSYYSQPQETVGAGQEKEREPRTPQAETDRKEDQIPAKETTTLGKTA